MLLIHKALDFQVRQVGNPEDRTLEFIGSTAAVDRYGDIIEPAGWDLKNYKKNPVFLWGHNYSMPPIGKAVSVKVTDDTLVFQIQFATAEEYAFADTIYRLYLGGFLKATSVGFQDLEREPIIDKKNEGRQTGWHFLKQELYELSGVTVPANPDAIMMAVQKGIITQEEAADFPKEAPSGPPLSDIDQRLAKLGLEPSSDQTILALCDLVEDLQEQLSKTPGVGLNLTLSDEQTALLQAAVEAAIAKAGAVLNAKNKEALTQARDLISQVLAAAESSSSEGLAATPNQSIYSLALNPGQEPHGGRPAGDSVNLTEILAGTKELHQLTCPSNPG
jgi:HK97 family phage prohead protease